MVTPCPLCHLSLDAWQQKLEAATGRTFKLPILHLAQLVGVAAGLEDSELKFKRHIVDPPAGAREAPGLILAMSETETTEPPAPVVNGTPREIADGVYVVPDGRVPLVPNVGIVLGEETALVVDTGMGPRTARASAATPTSWRRAAS